MGLTLGHDLCLMLLVQQDNAFLLTHHVGSCVSAAGPPACDACAGATGATGPAGAFQATGALITSFAASLSICLEPMSLISNLTLKRRCCHRDLLAAPGHLHRLSHASH